MLETETVSSGKKPWGAWATVGLGLAVIAVYFLIQILITVVFAIILVFSNVDLSLGPPQLEETMDVLMSHMGLLFSLTTIISAVLCLGLILLFIKIRKGISIMEYLGLRRITVKKILIVLAITLGFFILAEGLSALLGGQVQQGYSMLDIYSTSIWPALFWIAAVIFAPIFEEALFRGFLFEGFRQSRLGSIGAVGLTALGWSLLHIQYSFYGIAIIFAFGIVLGIVRIKTDSLWSPLIMHAFFNLLSMILVALAASGLVE